MKDQFVCIKTGPGELDFMDTIGLFMKLALVEAVIKDMSNCLEKIHDNGGVLDYNTNKPPKELAIFGMQIYLNDINHALKCARYGYKVANKNEFSKQ